MNERLLKILGGEEKFYPRELESKYPRIFEKIMFLWDKPGMDNYFTELLVQEREDRAGFPPNVAAEIMRLSLVHASSHSPNKKSDVWDVAADKFSNFKPPVSIGNENAWKPLPASITQAIESLGIPCSARGFHRAVETANRRAVASFLEARVNTEISDERGWTPLMLAAFNGHDEIVSLLLHHQANLHTQDLLGNTALHWAADAGKASSVKLLIEKQAGIEVRNNAGLTPLSQAAVRRQLGTVLQLIDSGASLNTTTSDGSTALHKVAAAGYTEIVRTLVHHGADTSIRNIGGDTPLALAEKNGQQSVIKILTSVPAATL